MPHLSKSPLKHYINPNPNLSELDVLIYGGALEQTLYTFEEKLSLYLARQNNKINYLNMTEKHVSKAK